MLYRQPVSHPLNAPRVQGIQHYRHGNARVRPLMLYLPLGIERVCHHDLSAQSRCRKKCYDSLWKIREMYRDP